MLPRARHFKAGKTLIVYALVVHLLLILAAAVGPGLHEEVHEDAQHADHECAITLFASGTCQVAPAPIAAVAPQLLFVSDEAVVERRRFASSFRWSGILEHAPPASA